MPPLTVCIFYPNNVECDFGVAKYKTALRLIIMDNSKINNPFALTQWFKKRETYELLLQKSKESHLS
tara:strand:+ start:4666 stop:4866 length:201 start_codon:yes stop_codon:yes gene_type:complete